MIFLEAAATMVTRRQGRNSRDNSKKWGQAQFHIVRLPEKALSRPRREQYTALHDSLTSGKS
jgi:hypothetical protein